MTKNPQKEEHRLIITLFHLLISDTRIIAETLGKIGLESAKVDSQMLLESIKKREALLEKLMQIYNVEETLRIE